MKRVVIKKKYIKIFSLVGIILIILLIFLFTQFFMSKKEKDMSIYHNETIIDNGDNYYIKVEYPKLFNKKINKKISDMVNDEISVFKSNTKILSEATDFEYELNIQYNVSKTNRLYSIHFIIYKYLGGAHYERDDLIYYYDYIDDKEVSWESLFVDKKDALNELSILTSNGLKSEYSEYIYSEKDMFKEGVKAIKNNFKYIMLNRNGLEVIFPPYQVGPWSSGEMTIKIGYKDINNILAEKYRGNEITEENKEIVSYKRKTRDIEKLKDKKLLALTFDDGPSVSTTKKLLDGLRERDAKVTFFVVGNRVKQHPEIVKKAYDDGHSIGSHTYSHKNLKNLTDKELKREIDRANNEIEEAIGKTTTIVRPPYGEYDKRVINTSGMTFILWSVDPQDWKYRDADIVYKHIIDNAKDGSIILLHDLYGTSVDAALMAIDTLLEEGYAFVSLEELEQLGKIDLNSNKAFFRIK